MDSYFNWLVNFVCDEEQQSKYTLLFNNLFNTEFIYKVALDQDRISDGLNLRKRFVEDNFTKPDEAIDDIDRDFCSVLEVLIALAIRCDEQIMCYGDNERIDEWFWLMIANMGIDMDNKEYDEPYVNNCINRMMERQYNSDGSNGGLFIVQNPRKNLRNIDIWYQMNLYLNEII